jgi:murein DD-endopeptidase MepM/ murein hydrolase activator NlpD
LLCSIQNRCKFIDSQLILKKRIYNFNQEVLQYENKTVPIRIIIGKVFRFFCITSLLSIILSIIFYAFFGSPIEKALQHRAETIKNHFLSINTQIDSLQNKLHSQLYANDCFYREVLELDSVPSTIRMAGTGGSFPSYKLENYPYNEIITSTSQKLNTIKHQIKVQDESYQIIYKAALRHNSELTTIPSIMPIKPIDNMYISSYFGSRTDPFTHLGRRHEGIDLVATFNTKIYATADGVVKLTKVSRRGYGKEIIISHKYGYITLYGHLNKIMVEEGQEIKRGQLIGLMGNTGRSTGTHLHYEVRLNKKPVNPIYFYADDLTSNEYEMITQLSVKDKI